MLITFLKMPCHYSEIERHSPLFRNSASMCIPGTIYKKVQITYVFIIMTKKAKHNNCSYELLLLLNNMENISITNGYRRKYAVLIFILFVLLQGDLCVWSFCCWVCV